MGLFRPAALTETDAEALIAAKLSWVLKGSQPAEVWVFGSAARGELTESSDIDLALIFDSLHEIAAARKSLAQTQRTDDWPQDVLYYTRSEFNRRAEVGGAAMIIRQEGRCLYPTKEGAD